MSSPAICLPWELSAERRFAAEALVAAAGARVTADRGPELGLDPAALDLAFHHLSRAEEAPGSEADEHGRFTGASSSL
ncbi:MAG: hypothetical protein ABI317_16635, partial [Gaiellales bacterium]